MISNSKYYLGDVSYHNTDYLLYSYYGVCYYLKEVALAGKKPTTQEELVNFHHFSLQNAIEEIFEVIKRGF